MLPAPRLSCEQCKRRKIRCNKGSPCSACQDACLECHAVQRARLPRGKSGKTKIQNKRLESRVAKIESLLVQHVRNSSEPCPSAKEDVSTKTGLLDGSHGSRSGSTPGIKMTNFVAPEFWATLSTEVQGLRETLEDSEDENIADAPTKNSSIEQSHGTCSTSALLFGFPNLTQVIMPTVATREHMTLLHMYRSRVDSVYKILHWPTTLSAVEARRACSLPNSASSSVQVLTYAIYFMAICSMADSEVAEIGFGNGPTVRQQYRFMVEGLLARSNLLQSPDVVVLQAFVIFLIGLRTCLSGASTWTLVAVAVRAATSLRLEEGTETHTAFEIQVRRRLLFAIGILDTHSALDRGTVPMLPSTTFAKPPLSINDEDMSPPVNVPSKSSQCMTDMSHTAMIYEAMVCQRRMYELSQAGDNGWENWPAKLETIAGFEGYVQRTALKIGNSSAPLHMLQKTSGQKILVSLQLLARRPPYRQPRNTVPPWDVFNVLEAATNVLEQHLQPMLPELELWAWKNWVQWHALAIVLAELLVRPQCPLSDRAYPVAIRSFRHYARIVADSESGMLWKPIAKLMRRVQRTREGVGVKKGSVVSTNSDRIGCEPEQVPEPMGLVGLHDMEILDFNTWELGSDGTNTHWTSDLSQGAQDNLCMSNDDTPWLAWDAFLQDVYIPDL